MRAKTKKAFVYRHKRLDTNEVFYIGVGVVKRRAWSKNGRNKHWHNIVNKHGFTYEILAEGIIREEACELEEFLISEYGRRDLGTGILVNMTGGGDGMFNPTKEFRVAASKRRTGTKHTNHSKEKIGKAQRRGLHHSAKPTIDLETGIIFSCAKDACEYKGLNYSTTKDKLSGRRNAKNNTSLRYYED